MNCPLAAEPTNQVDECSKHDGNDEHDRYGCYGGRYPHIHFEIFRGSAPANRLLVSQLAMPAEHSRQVYAQAAGYDGSGENFARMATATDGVFRDNSAAQLAAMTPRLRGSPTEGYTGEVTIAV